MLVGQLFFNAVWLRTSTLLVASVCALLLFLSDRNWYVIFVKRASPNWMVHAMSKGMRQNAERFGKSGHSTSICQGNAAHAHVHRAPAISVLFLSNKDDSSEYMPKGNNMLTNAKFTALMAREVEHPDTLMVNTTRICQPKG